MTTIAALATPPLPGAVGILRLSGPEAVSIAQTVFFPLRGEPLSRRGSHRMIYGEVRVEGCVIDRGLCVLMRAPNSYTGEDVVELQLHGAPTVLNAVLRTLYRAGALPARAGEFTRRAFVNGRMTLTQAEAVRDLVDAQTIDAARNAAGQLSGVLQRRFMAVYDALTRLLAHFQAAVDYPEEDIAPAESAGIIKQLAELLPELTSMLEGYDNSRAITAGVRCTLLGRPNVGKSSLLNALAGFERAIISPQPGTTRDTVEESVTLGGVLLRLTDSAGLRETLDPIEQQGVDRSRRAAEASALLLVVIDGSEELTEDDRMALDLAREAPSIILVNKCDLPQRVEREMLEAAFLHVCPVSALTGQGIEYIGSLVRRMLDTRAVYDGSVLTNERQAAAVRITRDRVQEAEAALRSGMTPDAVLLDIEQALDSMGEIIGRSVSSDLLDRIFSDFCVGK